jgi:hypothetical protein
VKYKVLTPLSGPVTDFSLYYTESPYYNISRLAGIRGGFDGVCLLIFVRKEAIYFVHLTICWMGK